MSFTPLLYAYRLPAEFGGSGDRGGLPPFELAPSWERPGSDAPAQPDGLDWSKLKIIDHGDRGLEFINPPDVPVTHAPRADIAPPSQAADGFLDDAAVAVNGARRLLSDIAGSLGDLFSSFGGGASAGDIVSGVGDLYPGGGDVAPGGGGGEPTGGVDIFALIDEVVEYISSESMPVVLDLSGKGINITPLFSSNFFFDTAGDGYRHRTAWTGAGNAVLAFDANNDGKIDQKNEIVFTDWDPSATSDMQALLDVFDTNHNGKLDAGDAKFAQFKLIVTNADGTQTLQTLSQAGVASIDLKEDNTRRVFADGSSIDGQTIFTRTNGTTGTAASVSLVSEAPGYSLQTTKTVDGAGAVTVDNKAYDPDGSLANETISIVSADGRSKTLKRDVDGDGVIDLVQTDATVVNAGGSTTQTLTDKTAAAVLIDKTVTTTSADGKTVTIQRDDDGSGSFEQTQALVVNADGSKSDTVSNVNDNGTLIDKTLRTTSANGLTRTDKFDRNGDDVWDLTSTDATVINADGSRTETITNVNANSSLRDKTTIATSADGRSKATQYDLDGNGTTDLKATEIVAVNADGSYVVTQTDSNGNGSLRDKTQTLLSADNLSKTISVDINGDGAWDTKTTDVIVAAADGSRTETTTDYNGNGSKRDQTIVVKGADGRSRTIKIDQNGDGAFDAIETIVVSAGASVDTIANYAAGGGLIAKSIVSTSADGLSRTTQADLNGDGAIDSTRTETTAKSGDGSSTTTVSDLNANGSLRDKTILTTSANGLSTTTKTDIDGNGSVDVTTTDATVVGADSSRTKTITQINANGSLHAKTVVTTSADHKSVTIVRDANGDGATDQTESVVTAADGATTDTVADFVPNGTLHRKTIATTNATGLSSTVRTDANGDGVWDVTTTDVVTLNADGSRTETIADANADGALRNRRVIQKSANGLSTTIQVDANGDGVWESTETDVTSLNADGSRSELVGIKNANGSIRGQTSIWTSAAGLAKMVSRDLDGNGRWDIIQNDSTVFGADGSSVRTVTDVNDNGSLRDKALTSVSADGRSRSASLDTNGDGQFDQVATLSVATNGDTIDTVTDYNPNGSKRDQLVTTTSANGLLASVRIDQNGDGVFDLTSQSSTLLNADGSSTTTQTDVNANGSLRDRTVTQTSASGLSKSTWIDVNGDGVWDTTNTVVTVLNADGGSTESVTIVNGNGSLREKSITTVSPDQKTTTIARDFDGNSVNDQTETIAIQANGATVDTTSNLNADGSTRNQRISTTSADGLSTSVVYKEWSAVSLSQVFVTTETLNDVTVLNSGGSRTETFTQRAGDANAGIQEQIVSTISDDGLVKTTRRTGSNGGNFQDVTATDITTLNANGSRTRVVTNQAGGGATAQLLDKSVSTISGSGLSTTLQLDVNGDGTFDTTNASATGVDGSSVETLTFHNFDGALRENTVSATRWDGRAHSLQRDTDGDGAVDHYETGRIEANGYRIEIVWDTKVDGSLKSRIVTTTGANALSKTVQVDSNGDGAIDWSQSAVESLNVDGSRTTTVSDFNGNGSLRDRTATTTTDDGLSKTSQIDKGGLGAVIETETDATVFNADGTVVRTVTGRYADGSLKDRTITTVNANGLLTSTSWDIDGNGAADRTDGVTVAVDGTKSATTTYMDGATVTTTTSFDGRATTVTSSSGVIQRTVGTADASGSYSWSSTDSYGFSLGLSSHTIDSNNIDTYTFWNRDTSGVVRLDAATEQSYLTTVERIYDAAFDRNMTLDERELFGRFVDANTGILNAKRLANELIGSNEFSTRYGNLSNLEFVERVYQNGYGRSASLSDLASYVSKLNSGTITRADLLNAVSISSEHIADGNVHAATNNSVVSPSAYSLEHSTDRQVATSEITRLYRTALGRDPSASELSSGVQAIINGSATETQIANNLFSVTWVWWPYVWSPSVFEQTYGSLSNSDFVGRLYLNAFGRNPTAQERSQWVTFLDNSSTTRGEIVDVIVKSPDYLSYIGANAGQSIVMSNGTLNFAGNVTANVTGGNNTINGSKGDILTVGGNGATGANNIVNMSYGSANLLGNSRMDVIGSRNVISAAAGSNVGVNGDDNLLSANGDGVWINGGSGNVVDGSGNTVIVGANIGVDIVGDGNTVNAQSGAKITIATNGQGGAADTVNMSSGSLVMAGGSKATLNGSGNTVTFEYGESLTLSGSNNRVVFGAGNDVVSDAGSSETFVFDANFGQDTIAGFDNTDRIQIDSAIFADWAHLLGAAQQVGSDTLITASATDTIVLKNIAVSSLNQSQFQFA